MYTAKIGAAIYVFAYYEWAVIYLVQQYRPGFVSKYCRGKPMTSGGVLKVLMDILADPTTAYDVVPRPSLQRCCDNLSELIQLRNALIHAHPITDSDGTQVLNYQGAQDRPLPDMKWPLAEIEAAIAKFDQAAVDANDLLHTHLRRAA